MINLFLILILLSLGAPAFAQGGMQVPCGDLAEADCEILQNAQQASMSLKSATFDLNVDLAINNIPDSPFDSLAFNLSGDGAYAVDPALMAQLSDMQSNAAAMMQDLQALPQFFDDLLSGFSGELNLTLQLPQEVTDMASSGDMTIPNTLSVQLRLVDGNGYINLDDLAAALPDANVPSGWYGVELARTMRMLMEMSVQQMGDLEDMPSFDPNAFSQFTNPEFVNQYVTVERLDDQEGSAVFRMSIDYPGLFGSPEMRDLMQTQMKAQAEAMGSEVMSEAELDQMLSMMGSMFEGVSLEMIQTIGLDDYYTRSVQMIFTWDLAGMMQAMGEMGASSDSATASQAAPVIKFNATFNVDDFNSAPAIEAPAGVEALTAAQLLGMLNMNGSGSGSSQ